MQAVRKRSQNIKPRAGLPDAALIDLVQRQTFRFFWEGAHPLCGLARDRTGLATDPADDLVCTGGSGFAVMAIIVAAERGWITRDEAANRLALMLGFLERAPCYHGLFPHFMNGRTGAAIRFGRKDDGSDIVETSFLFQGLLCARQYFNADNPAGEKPSRSDYLVVARCRMELARAGRPPCLDLALESQQWLQPRRRHPRLERMPYYLCARRLLAALPDRPRVYHDGFAQSRTFINRRRYYDIDLPLGPDFGGPLFFAIIPSAGSIRAG